MPLEKLVYSPMTATGRPPILFVHGAWHAAWCWQEFFLPYFARQGYPALAFSLRGHGASPQDKPLRRTRIADYVADLAVAAAELPELPVLVGHSMGGLIVQKYLETHPARGAVLLASVPVSGVLRASLRLLRRHPAAFLKANLRLSLYPFVETPALAEDLLFGSDIPVEQRRLYFARLQDESFLAFLDMMLFSLPQPAQARAQAPFLVLGGEKDGAFTPAEVEATARAYGVTAEIFPGLPHDLMLHPHWQPVADRILSWLAELP